MHAFLIHSRSKDFIAGQTSKLITSLQSIKLTYELQTIENVREITRFTQLTAKQKSTIYIENIDTASVDAQNAFLKTLEEPQENISFILTAQNLERVVPTILSRVEVINDDTQSEVSEDTTTFADEFINASIGEQLTITSKIKKREEAIEFIKNIIIGGHALLTQGKDVSKNLEVAQKTYEALEKNGNVQIQLTNFVVHLQS